MEKTDLQLIEESLRPITGRYAFSVLIERHTRSIYLFIYKLTKNKEDSEDITQETFIKAWQKIQKYNRGKSFKTWLFTIAKNTAIDKLRKKKSINFSSINSIFDTQNIDDSDSDFESNIADTEMLPDEIFEQRESEENLKKALQNIPESQRLIIDLHINEGLSFEEISEIIAKPMNTVKSQFRRAILKLRELL